MDSNEAQTCGNIAKKQYFKIQFCFVCKIKIPFAAF